jgi:chemotaxis protein CheC
MNHELSDKARDALGEFMNIGAANAATALNKLLGQRVDVEPPRVEMKKVEEVIDFVGDADSVQSMVVMRIEGENPGVILLVFPEDATLKMTQIMTKSEGPVKTDLDNSALCEAGNILAGSCFASINQFLGMKFEHSEPNTATDMVGAMLSSILADLGQDSEKVLAAEVHTLVPDLDIDGGVFFIFSPKSTQTILEATERKLGA